MRGFGRRSCSSSRRSAARTALGSLFALPFPGCGVRRFRGSAAVAGTGTSGGPTKLTRMADGRLGLRRPDTSRGTPTTQARPAHRPCPPSSRGWPTARPAGRRCTCWGSAARIRDAEPPQRRRNPHKAHADARQARARGILAAEAGHALWKASGQPGARPPASCGSPRRPAGARSDRVSGQPGADPWIVLWLSRTRPGTAGEPRRIAPEFRGRGPEPQQLSPAGCGPGHAAAPVSMRAIHSIHRPYYPSDKLI